MPSIADEYRGKAHEAQVTELETHDPFLRRSYAKLAAHWNELADRVEREENRTHHQRASGSSSDQSS
jgi:phage shock protein A